jgi:hypothetical protein
MESIEQHFQAKIVGHCCRHNASGNNRVLLHKAVENVSVPKSHLRTRMR